MNYRLMLLCGMILSGKASAWSSVVLWDEQSGGTGHYYKFVLTDQNPTWHEARDAAANSLYLGRRGHLLTVNSSAEHTFIESIWAGQFVNSAQRNATWAWIGLTDENEEGNFEWITGEPLTFTAWNIGQPNNEIYRGQDEDYVHYWFAVDGEPFSWNDSVSPAANANNGLQIGYFVEYSPASVPEPAITSLLALTGIFAAGWKRFRPEKPDIK